MLKAATSAVTTTSHVPVTDKLAAWSLYLEKQTSQPPQQPTATEQLVQLQQQLDEINAQSKAAAPHSGQDHMIAHLQYLEKRRVAVQSQYDALKGSQTPAPVNHGYGCRW